MASLALLQKQETLLLPGELPQHRNRGRLHKHSISVRDHCLDSLSASKGFSSTNDADISAQQDHLRSACHTQPKESEEELKRFVQKLQNENEEEVKKIVLKLDNIVGRLAKTYNLDPSDIGPHSRTITQVSSEEPIAVKCIEDSIDKIIQKISERQQNLRAGNEHLCRTLPHLASPQTHYHSGNSPGSPKYLIKSSPYSVGQCYTVKDNNSTTPPRTQHIHVNSGTPNSTARPSPLGLSRALNNKGFEGQECNDCLTPQTVASRSLLPRFDSLGKEDLQSPASPNAGKIRKTKSGRLASALSFLTSPVKSGANAHRGGSPMER